MAKGNLVHAPKIAKQMRSQTSGSFHWFDSFIGFFVGVVFVFVCFGLFYGFMQVRTIQESQLQKDITSAAHTQVPLAVTPMLQDRNPPLAIQPVTSYVVQPGDTLWDIAVKLYGDGYSYTEIIVANHLDNPSLIFSGNILSIPRN